MSSPASATPLPRWLILLGVITAIGPLSIDMYLPAFPTIETSLGGWHGSVELTLASFFIGLTLGQLFYGPISDRIGRRVPLFVGLAIYTLGSVLSACASSIPMLIVTRFLQGVGGCAGISLPGAIVRDRLAAQDSARAFSRLMLVMGLAPILAPLLGGAVLLHLGWRGIFLVLSVFGVSCLAIIWVGLAESHDTRHEPPLRVAKVICNYLGLLRNHGYLGYALGGGLAMSGMFAYIAGSPFVLIRLFGVEPQHYGLFFGANAFGLIASSQINAHLLRTTAATVILRRALQVPPVVGIVLVAASFSGHLSLWLVAGAFFCFVASLGFIIPNATAAALASHGQQAGTAAALASALQFGCATLAGALVGVFRDATARPLVIVMALCGMGAWASHALLTRRAHVLVEMAHSRDSRSS